LHGWEELFRPSHPGPGSAPEVFDHPLSRGDRGDHHLGQTVGGDLDDPEAVGLGQEVAGRLVVDQLLVGRTLEELLHGDLGGCQVREGPHLLGRRTGGGGARHEDDVEGLGATEGGELRLSLLLEGGHGPVVTAAVVGHLLGVGGRTFLATDLFGLLLLGLAEEGSLLATREERGGGLGARGLLGGGLHGLTISFPQRLCTTGENFSPPTRVRPRRTL